MTIIPHSSSGVKSQNAKKTLEFSASRLKVWPEVWSAALQAKLDRCFRLWTIARAVDTSGSGRLGVSRLQEELDKRGVRGGAPGTVRRLLQKGDGVFWTTYRDRRGNKILQLRGLANVAASLGVDRLRLPNPATIPWALALTIGDFRAACFAARFARQGDGDDAWSRPISRFSLTKATSASAHRQRRWQRELGGRLQSACNAVPFRLCTGRPTPRKLEDGETVHVGAVGRKLDRGQFIERFDIGGLRFYFICERLPNSYKTDKRSIAPSPRGRTGKINGRLRARQMRRDKLPRLYYDPKTAPEVRATSKAWSALRGKEQIYTRAALLPGVGWQRSVKRNGRTTRLWERHEAQSFYG